MINLYNVITRPSPPTVHHPFVPLSLYFCIHMFCSTIVYFIISSISTHFLHFLFVVVADLKNPSVVYSWHSVGVLEFNPSKKLFLVHKADRNGRVRDVNGRPVTLKSKSKGKQLNIHFQKHSAILHFPGQFKSAASYMCISFCCDTVWSVG